MMRNPGSRVRASRRGRKTLFVSLVLLIAAAGTTGMIGAVAAGSARRDSVLEDEQKAFDRSAASLSAGVATSLLRNTDIVASAGAFVGFNHELNNPRFQKWFEEGSLDRYPGLMGFGYVERVAHADLPAFVAEVTADPTPSSTGEFILVPPGPRSEYCLARFRAIGASSIRLELRAGVDICTVPGLGTKFAEVRRTGNLVVLPLPAATREATEDLPALNPRTSPITGTEFLVIAPVRVAGSSSTGPDSVRGWILAGFDGPKIMQSLPRLDPELAISLSWSDGGRRVVIAETERQVEGDVEIFESVQTFDADGEWTMTVRRAAADAYASARNQQRAVTGAGVLFTALALAFVWLLVGARNRALRLVDQKTDQLKFQALHDGLTGLPNRVLILDRAEQMLHRARREGFSPVAMFIDMDNFKTINDTLGHAAGDGLLCTIAERLRTAARDADSVGRLGGDEFVVLADGGSGPGWAEAFAQRLVDAVAEPVYLEGLGDTALTVGISIGIATGDRESADILLRDADIALYAAKDRGKGGFAVFRPSMQRAVREKLALELDFA